MPEPDDECEYANCTCVVTGDEAVTLEGHRFCSNGCANGEGCVHGECNCAEHTA